MNPLLDNLRTLVRYRWLLYELVLRDVKLRYRGSLLGVFWTLLNPLLFLAVYTLVFSVIMKSSIRDFPLFLLAGMVPFFWFSGAVGTAASSISSAAGYVGKTLMPPELLVYVPVLSNGVNFLITIVLLFPVSLFLGVNVGWALLFLLPLLIIELLMTLGISLLVATANVFYRDWQQIIAYVLTALFFLTPIFYAKGAIPPKLQFLVTFSPLAALISGYQSIFYYGAHPVWHELIFAGAFSLIVLVVAMAIFNRYRDAFAEYV